MKLKTLLLILAAHDDDGNDPVLVMRIEGREYPVTGVSLEVGALKPDAEGFDHFVPKRPTKIVLLP